MLMYALLGIWGFVLANILAQDGMIFSRINVYLHDNLPEILYKPIIGCSYCIAGQWCLWCYLWSNWSDLNLFNLVASVAVGIFTVHLAMKVENLSSR